MSNKIVLDDDKLTITAGHCVINGVDSTVGMNSPQTGTWTVGLNGKESQLLLAHPDTKFYTVNVDGKNSILWLHDTSGHETISLDGNKKKITTGHCVIDGNGSALSMNSPRTGTWTVGLDGKESTLLLAHPDTRYYTVSLDGKKCAIGLNDSNGHPAILLDGNAGDIILQNADCAEEFTIRGLETIEPGTVMVLGEEGALCQSTEAYDKKVAGVISGAGDFKPGLILDKKAGATNRMPIALMGKVYCKVDAEYGAIEVGSLLTTSPTLGHAMRADDPMKAFGAVIGKALRPLKEGQGLIPILIALQ